MLEQYYRINKVAGLDILIRPDGSVLINACELIATGKQLDFGKKAVDLKNVNDLTKELAAKSLLAINLTGKGILTKQVERIEEISSQDFAKLFPNALMDDFYIQNFISGESSFVSIIRKADADQWLGKLKELGFQPLVLSLGIFPLQNVISQLNAYGDEVIINHHIIKRNEALEWVSVNYSASAIAAFPFKIEQENIPGELIIPYATAFQMILASGLNPIQADVPELEAAHQQQLSNNKVKVYGFIILVCCFILLLINFALFSWLTSANEQMSAQVSMTAQSASDVNKINDQIQQKELLLKGLGWEGAINKSSLVDQLAALLPPEVVWTELAIDPVDASTNHSQKSLIFVDREISITGTSEKIIPVNEWMARIKTRAWVKKVELKNYTYNSELNTGTFTISIDY